MEFILALGFAILTGVCIAYIAKKLNRHPIVFGVLGAIPLLQIVALAVLAFTDAEQ